MKGRQRSVRDCIEILVTNGGEISQANPAVGRLRIPLPAVHGDFVTAGRQAGGYLFGKSFESAVACGNAARAQYRDAHYELAVSERARRRATFFGACLLTGAYWNQLAM